MDELITEISNVNINKKKYKKKKNKKKILNRTETSHAEILAKKEYSDSFGSVVVVDDSTKGRHLVARKKIMPGEIVMVAKPFSMVSSISKAANFCNNCLDINWSGIPCQYCVFGMFCSEKCQKEAVEKYHDIECNVVNKIVSGNNYIDYLIQISLRTIVIGFKEFGGIEQLREAIETVDKNNGMYFCIDGTL